MGGVRELEKLISRQRFGVRPGLGTIRALLAKLGDPHQGVAAVHIAGTNGKGSVAALCESILRHAGYSVGRFNSPHLLRVNERFLLNGECVANAELEEVAGTVERAASQLEAEAHTAPTYFEALTAVAFLLLRKHGIKLAVLETGMGGRWDATNVVTPLVSVFTRIGVDHCAYLGETPELIAREKGGIIKPGRPVVCGMMPAAPRAVLRGIAEQSGSRFIDATRSIGAEAERVTLKGQSVRFSSGQYALPPIKLPLAGCFQVENACTALATIECVTECGLTIPDKAIVEGMEGVCWPGRFQLIEGTPLIVVDGAHNPDGARALARTLKACKITADIGMIVGYCQDKDMLAHARELAPYARRAWAVPVPNPRSASAGECAAVLRMAGVRSVDECIGLTAAVADAKKWAMACQGLVVICGSLFLAGAALRELGAYPWPLDRVDSNEVPTSLMPEEDE